MSEGGVRVKKDEKIEMVREKEEEEEEGEKGKRVEDGGLIFSLYYSLHDLAISYLISSSLSLSIE